MKRASAWIIAFASMLAMPASAETVLRGRLNADIISTDPGTRRDENTDAVMLHIVEGLVASREDGSVGPMLAESWTVSDDGRTTTFALRPGVAFHNGAPLTADDVVWALNRYLNAETRWRCRGEFTDTGIGKITSVTAPDGRTVVIAMDRVAPMLLKTLARADCGGTGIIHRASVDANGAWIAPIGTGPFRLGEWRKNQFIELLRFEGYVPLPTPRDGNGGGKAALVDRVRLMVIPDGSAARVALLRGNIDVLDNISPNELGGIDKRQDVRLDVTPTMDFYTLLFQTGDPLLSDVRLRQAIALTIDTAGLTKAITWGTAAANNSPVPTSSPYYTAVQSALRAVDLDAARRLLKEAGYQGQPIQLITNRRYPQSFDGAVLIQAMAAQVGINIEIETLDWATQLARYNAGTYQMMAQPYSARLDPSLNLGAMVGDKAVDPRKVWGTPEARSLLRRSMDTGDPVQRQAIFDDMHRAFMAEVPAVILYNSARLTAVRSNVTGYKNWPAALQRLWGVGLGP